MTLHDTCQGVQRQGHFSYAGAFLTFLLHSRSLRRQHVFDEQGRGNISTLPRSGFLPATFEELF